MRKLLFAAALVLAAPATAVPPLPVPPSQPKLLVVISVDQLSADLFDEYRPQFTGGLARLASGVVFRNGYQSHAATETCPGHSTILTGAHPSRTGIIANLWVDQSVQRSDVTVYCAEDERVPGTSSTAYQVSPLHLLVPTLGDLMKARWPGSRNIAIAGKDRAAAMMTGHRADQRWYWDGKTFSTDLVSAPVPQAVPKVKALVAAALAQPRPPLEPTPLCRGKEREIPIEGGGRPVGTSRFARGAGDTNAFRASPEIDGDTLALAAALVDEMQLGRRAEPDVLAIGLSGTDYVGHSYGTEGIEMCLQLLALDREIGDFLKALDYRSIDYAVVLTADHGGQDIPERKRLAGMAQAARVDPALGAAAMGKKLTAELGLPAPGLLGESSFGDIYVDRKLPAADRKRLINAAVAAYRAHPQVEAVFTAEQIEKTPAATTSPDRWTLIQRARASYYPGRSGDFVVMLKRDITPLADTSRYVATHGSPWDYDRRVPIVFWRPWFPATTVEAPADTVDILPTLAGMIALDIEPGSIDGKCLGAVPSVVCSTSAGASKAERGER